MAQKAKLEAAQRLLADLSIAEVSAHFGYESPFHFSRLFKKHLGISPGSWRKQNT